jgi:hypothetical protein
MAREMEKYQGINSTESRMNCTAKMNVGVWNCHKKVARERSCLFSNNYVVGYWDVCSNERLKSPVRSEVVMVVVTDLHDCRVPGGVGPVPAVIVEVPARWVPGNVLLNTMII